MSKIKQECTEYLGERGIFRDIKRCKKFKNLWFIVFKDYPEDVEISFIGSIIYECYDEIHISLMKWNILFYQKTYLELNNEGIKWVI